MSADRSTARCPLLGRFDMYISKVNWEQVICPLNRGCLLFREFVIRGFNVVYSECLSAIEGPTVLSMHERCLFGHQST